MEEDQLYLYSLEDFERHKKFIRKNELQNEIDYEEVYRNIRNIQDVKNKLVLDLRNNFMDKNIMVSLLKLIEKNKQIKYFNLWMPGNRLTDVEACQIIRAISGMKLLEFLSINFEWNFALTDKTFRTLCVVLPQMLRLKEIHIRFTEKTFIQKNRKSNFITLINGLKNIRIAKYDGYNIIG